MTNGYEIIDVGECTISDNISFCTEIPNLYDRIEGATKPLLICGDIKIVDSFGEEVVYRITAPFYLAPYIEHGLIQFAVGDIKFYLDGDKIIHITV